MSYRKSLRVLIFHGLAARLLKTETTLSQILKLFLKFEGNSPGENMKLYMKEISFKIPALSFVKDRAFSCQELAGVGPKMVATLQAAKIETYGQLVSLTEKEVNDILGDPSYGGSPGLRKPEERIKIIKERASELRLASSDEEALVISKRHYQEA